MIQKTVKTDVLNISYLEYGDVDGWPCVLGHGFPYDVHAYAECAPQLASAGARVIVPYLRGYGSTQFLSASTIRSGEQAAWGADLLAVMDALSIESAVVGGYDWGGRAACVVAALWPERVTALVTGNSYNIQNIARAMEPASPAEEASFWYQYFFHCQRGQNALESNRDGITRLLWEMWSPTWSFTDDTFAKTSSAFVNPDFVEVVIHSYRHRYGLVAGDPAVIAIENRLAQQPDIHIPTIAIDGDQDGVITSTQAHRAKFTGPHDYRIFQGAGHNLPQEKPDEWVQAVLDARAMSL